MKQNQKIFKSILILLIAITTITIIFSTSTKNNTNNKNISNKKTNPKNPTNSKDPKNTKNLKHKNSLTTKNKQNSQKNNINYITYLATSQILQGGSICNYEDPIKNQNCEKFLSKIRTFILKNSNPFVFLTLDTKCKNSILKDNSYEKFLELFGASGKNLEDYGLKSLCEDEGHEYYFFNLELSENTVTNPQFIFLLKFLEIKNFSFGFCNVPYCKRFFNNFFNEEKNAAFFSYLKTNGINSLKIMKEPKNKEFSYLFKLQIYIFLIYLAFRMLISFMNFLIISIKNKKTTNKSQENLLRNYESGDVINNNNEEFTNITSINIPLGENNNNKCLNFIKNVKNFIKELYNIFCFRLNFLRLIDIEYIFYNEKNMENFSYWKSLILLTLTINLVISSAIIMPHRDYFNSKNFSNFSFIFYKLTIYAVDCYIALEACVFTFRIMNYIKKKGSSFNVFIKFYLLSLPKIFLFFFIFFTFQLQIENYGKFVDDKYSFYNNFIFKLKEKECFSDNNFVIFDYFNFAYSEKSSEKFEKYKKCFSWVYVNINIFLSFTFFIFIFYFSLKIKKKIFDYLITFIFLCLFLTIYFNFLDLNFQGNFYKLSFIQGEILSIKQLHLFCVKYFLGVLTGLFFFYSNDILLNDSYISNKENYLPFEFMFLFLKFLNEKQTNKINRKTTLAIHTMDFDYNNNNDEDVNSKNINSFIVPSKKTTLSSKEKERKESLAIFLSKSSANLNNLDPSVLKSFGLENILTKKRSIKKNIIFLIISIISMLFLISYGFIRMNIEDFNGKYLPIKFYFDLWLLYIFERFLFLFNFLIFIISMSSINLNTRNFKDLPKSKFFLIFGRIDFVFFSMLEIVILFFFSIYNIQLYFSYQILFFISIGIYISMFTMSICFVYLFELPWRILLKRILSEKF